MKAQGFSGGPRQRRGRRAVGAALLLFSAAMVVGAAWLGAYPFYTNIRADRRQATLAVTFEEATKTLSRQEYQAGKVEEGNPLTRIIIPRMDVDTLVVEGINGRALAAGAGHYRNTPLPGEPGNVGIAGHRSMNGKPFADLDMIRPGDEVILVTPFARHIYRVTEAFDGHANPWVTTPDDWSVVAKTVNSMLTLTTCHPKGSARERLVARAELMRTEPTSRA